MLNMINMGAHDRYRSSSEQSPALCVQAQEEGSVRHEPVL